MGFIYSGSRYFYVRNIQGDIESIYKEDGSLVAKYLYDAYGNHKVLSSTLTEDTDSQSIGNLNPFRYRGYYYDVYSNLYYCNNRYYSPKLCRWISPDSIEYLDPDSINGLNLYAYCGNNPIMNVDPSGHSALLIGLIIGAVFGFGVASYIDYRNDGQIFDENVAWYDYLGATVFGGVIGALFGILAGMSFSTSLPTFRLINSGNALMFDVTGTITVTVTGTQILGVVGLLGATYMFASNNRPGNNRVQNKQFEQAARSAGYNPKDPRVRDILNEIHQYIRKNKLNLGWKELLELIKEWLG